jgi:hypothetical protein
VLELLQGALEYGKEIAYGTFVLREDVHAQTTINGIGGQSGNEEIELNGIIDMIVFPCSTKSFFSKCICILQ